MLPYLLCFQIFQIFYAKPNRVISFFVVLVVGEIQIAEPPTVMQSGVSASCPVDLTKNSRHHLNSNLHLSSKTFDQELTWVGGLRGSNTRSTAILHLDTLISLDTMPALRTRA